MIKASVIIPAHNAMGYLPETIINVLQQNLKNFEVIVVNDGSTDDIESWFAQHVSDPRVTLISQLNKGLSGARNTGIQHSQGEYIAFLDADDLWEPDKLQKQVRILDGDPIAGLVYTWVAYIDPQGKPSGRIRKNNAEGHVWSTLIQHNIVECGSVALVRRDCFDKVGEFDESLRSLEDLDMWLRLAPHYEFRGIPEALVYYRQHPSSLSRNWPVMEANFRKVLDRAFDDAPAELAHLRCRSYAQAYICLSWKPIQNKYRDYPESARLLSQAISYDATIRLTAEYWRLSLVIITLKYLGIEGYERLLPLVYRLQRWLSFRHVHKPRTTVSKPLLLLIFMLLLI